MQEKKRQSVITCVYLSRWTVCVVLCCVVLLVVLCNLLGLVLGPLGLTPKADPTKRSCTSDCGGIFLIMWVLNCNVISFSHMMLLSRGETSNCSNCFTSLPLVWPLTWMWLQGRRFQLPLLLAVHDRGAGAVLAGRECLHSALSALEQRRTAKGSYKKTQTHLHTPISVRIRNTKTLQALCEISWC